MGGHKWVPQNRGLNVCTSGYGCTICAVYYEERVDYFSYERYEAFCEAQFAARMEALRVAAQAEEAEAEAKAAAHRDMFDFSREFLEGPFAVKEPRQPLLIDPLPEFQLNARGCEWDYPIDPSTSPSDGEALRASPVLAAL